MTNWFKYVPRRPANDGSSRVYPRDNTNLVKITGPFDWQGTSIPMIINQPIQLVAIFQCAPTMSIVRSKRFGLSHADRDMSQSGNRGMAIRLVFTTSLEGSTAPPGFVPLLMQISSSKGLAPGHPPHRQSWIWSLKFWRGRKWGGAQEPPRYPQELRL